MNTLPPLPGTDLGAVAEELGMDQDKVQASHLHSLLHQQSRVLGTDHGDELNGGREALKLTRGGERGGS